MRRKRKGNFLIASLLVFGCMFFLILALVVMLFWNLNHQMEKRVWIIVLCMGLLLVLFAAFCFWWCIYRPLEKLETALQSLESVSGKKSMNLWANADVLAESIHGLLDELKHSMEREHAEALLRQQFQYAELQNQIHPHFLYNTLETIRGQAIIDDNYKIADMTETLAKYFRYNISKNKEDVTLEQELDNIQNYIRIQQYRFQDRFRFHIHTHTSREEYAFCMIPKMTLQPIVENAIFHGIEPKMEAGNIRIHIDTTEEKLIIIVADDGVGMEEQTLKTLNAKLHSADQNQHFSPKEGHNGIAMENVNSRLRMLYGEDYGLHVTSTKGLGTEVEITLPKIQKKEVEG